MTPSPSPASAGSSPRPRRGLPLRGPPRRRRPPITLTQPARGVATGRRSAVLYDGDTVMGSATITATRLAVTDCSSLLAVPPMSHQLS